MVVKKSPAKKTVTKKAVIRKAPTVTVETKKINAKETCTSSSCHSRVGGIVISLFIVANTVLLALILINQTKMESLRAGGSENYGLLKQVFQTEGYKAQQKQQLEQALEVLSQPQQMPTANDLQVAPEQLQ